MLLALFGMGRLGDYVIVLILAVSILDVAVVSVVYVICSDSDVCALARCVRFCSAVRCEEAVE